MFTKIGIHFPDHTALSQYDSPDEEFYNDETGMEYSVYSTYDDDLHIVGASHVDVGLVTYYEVTGDLDTWKASVTD